MLSSLAAPAAPPALVRTCQHTSSNHPRGRVCNQSTTAGFVQTCYCRPFGASQRHHRARVTRVCAMTDSSKHIGFLGLGIMGEAMARNLLKSGKFASVTVWNRSPNKCEALKSAGASVAGTPSEVIKKCDVVYAMLADPDAARAVATGPDGVATGMEASPGKAYVDVSTVDEKTSQDIAAAVKKSGGRFLEAPVSGSKKPAIDGQLIFLCGGDEALYKECETAFDIMGKAHYFLGDVGTGARMKLIVNMIMGSMMCAFSEGMALTEKSDLKQDVLLDVLSKGAMANPMFALKGPGMMNGNFPPAFPLKHQQKDMRLACELGDQLKQELPVAQSANSQFKRAIDEGHGDEDFAAVYATTSK